MTPLVVVAAVVAGGLGAVVRYAITRAVPRPTRAVLVANIAGSALAGIAIAFPSDVQYIVLSGFAGGLTTFSTWSVETVQLMNDGKSNTAVGNVVLNLAVGLVAAVIAYGVTLAILTAPTAA
jgi:CrcB protein